MCIFENYKLFVISADPIVHLVLIRVKFRDNSLTSATMVLFDSKSAQLGSSSESQIKHLIADPFLLFRFVCVLGARTHLQNYTLASNSGVKEILEAKQKNNFYLIRFFGCYFENSHQQNEIHAGHQHESNSKHS